MISKRFLTRLLAVAVALALPLALAVTAADARVGGGSSSGSRGSRTFSAPPSTTTAPGSAQPMQRSITQPGSSTTGGFANQGNRGGLFGGMFSRPGLLGGLAAGFLGAGLFGMLFGHGLFGGLSGFGSIFGLILQIALIVIVARLLIGWWQRRNAPAYAGSASAAMAGPQAAPRTGFGMGLGSGAAPLEIGGADYTAFEQLLGDIQAAWSNEDLSALRGLATPEMVSYFAEDMTANAGRGVVNKVTDVKLMQGDLAEAWREDGTDYATVAMRFALVDRTIERASGRLVEGSDQPVEVTEVWTFRRDRGGRWMLSAIQQT